MRRPGYGLAALTSKQKDMNLITLTDRAGNEILLNIDGISSCSFVRYGDKKAALATVFMKSGEKHAFSGEEAAKLEAAKLDDKLKAI